MLEQVIVEAKDATTSPKAVFTTFECDANKSQISKTKVVFISFQTLKKPRNVDVFVRAHSKSVEALRAEIASHVPAPAIGANGSSKFCLDLKFRPCSFLPFLAISKIVIEALIIFDTLHTLCSTVPETLPAFLSSLLSPTSSVLAVYHTDIPLPSPSKLYSSYAPSPLQTLLYLATSILKVSQFSHELEKKKARDKSLPEPTFGIAEQRDGVLMGMRSSNNTDEVVVEMEVRRKSGRGVKESFVITPAAIDPSRAPPQSVAALAKGQLAHIVLLDDHPAFAKPADPMAAVEADGNEGGGEDHESTFSLGLTEKQRRDREGVVLPYFDAQKGAGPGEGGRILYEMGREDDYDEDEDDEFA